MEGEERGSRDVASVRLHMIVWGRVQGVWFRESTRAMAERLGLTGTVRNLPTGEVEIVVEGPNLHVKMLEAWAHQGPPNARVDGKKVRYSPATGEFRDFRVIR